MSKFLYHQKPSETKHTRRSFAGNFNESTNELIIGIAGNHVSDSFNKAKGRLIATGRSEVVRQNLQEQGKQLIISNVTKEEAKDVFFKTINQPEYVK